MDVPLIEQIAIQAQVLVPLVQALEVELGVERARAIVRRTLGEHYRALGARWWRAQAGGGVGDAMAAAFERFAAGDALDYQVVQQTADTFDVDVTRCRYAELYRRLGAPELGSLLVCSADGAMADGAGELQLTRTQTIMQGATHCDFRYARIRRVDE
jgi:hypothetical protein